MYVNLGKDVDVRPFLYQDTAENIIKMLDKLGESEEDLLSEYDMIESVDASDEPEDIDYDGYVNNIELAAQQDSEQDSPRYKVRYVYVKGTRKQPKGESRPLCKALISASRVYRKEDILQMSSAGGAERNGVPYSVWLYKGGKYCYHRWERRLYRKKLNKEGQPWGGGALNGTQKISVNDARRQGFSLPVNNPSVAVAPIDTPTRGGLT